MIIGLLHPGSGLGNMLHRYIATRIKALELGVDFSMINPEGFKGKSFINLDMGKPNDIEFHIEEGTGKIIPHSTLPLWNEWDKHCYDPDFNFIQDNTIIDGNFEDERYFETHLDDIREWIKTEPLEIPLEIPDDTCIIGFRGGEFYTVLELGLPKEYYDRAIIEMQKLGINKFEVHTDDEELAKQFFPDYKIIHDIELNWRATRDAMYAIIANSSFYVLPRLMPRLMSRGMTIAPRYWNRYNTKKWDYPQSYYKSFKYI